MTIMRLDAEKRFDMDQKLPGVQQMLSDHVFFNRFPGLDISNQHQAPEYPPGQDIITSPSRDESPSSSFMSSSENTSLRQSPPYPDSQTRRSSLVSYGSHGSHVEPNSATVTHLYDYPRFLGDRSAHRAADPKKRQHSDKEKGRRNLQNRQIDFHAEGIPDFVKAVTEVADSKTNRNLPAKTVGLERSLLYRMALETTVQVLLGMLSLDEQEGQRILNEEYVKAAERLPSEMDRRLEESNQDQDDDLCSIEDGSQDALKRKKRACKGGKPKLNTDKCQL